MTDQFVPGVLLIVKDNQEQIRQLLDQEEDLVGFHFKVLQEEEDRSLKEEVHERVEKLGEGNGAFLAVITSSNFEGPGIVAKWLMATFADLHLSSVSGDTVLRAAFQARLSDVRHSFQENLLVRSNPLVARLAVPDSHPQQLVAVLKSIVKP